MSKNDPKLFRIRPVPPIDAEEDNVLVLIDPAKARELGIELDPMGFPVPGSLREWHKKNNPQFFADDGEK